MSLVNTPVLIQAFNRPEQTRKLVDALLRENFEHLIVAVDGPRADRALEANHVLEVRQLLERLRPRAQRFEAWYLETNLGNAACAHHILSRAFSENDMLIVLEDDCVPHPDFFRFCEATLRAHEGNEDIFHINGSALATTARPGRSKMCAFAMVWGWASWARAWTGFSGAMTDWKRARDEPELARWFDDPEAAAWFADRFDRVAAGAEGWDHCWRWHHWRQRRLAIVPPTNMIRNTGFGTGAAHTTNRLDHRALRPLRSLPQGWSPEASVERNPAFDRRVFRRWFRPSKPLRMLHRARVLFTPK